MNQVLEGLLHEAGSQRCQHEDHTSPLTDKIYGFQQRGARAASTTAGSHTERHTFASDVVRVGNTRRAKAVNVSAAVETSARGLGLTEANDPLLPGSY